MICLQLPRRSSKSRNAEVTNRKKIVFFVQLHQGSVCQFPEKDPRPNYKNELAEYSHIDEASKYMLPKKTVAQFTEKNPNPNYKNELAEYSHVDEHMKYVEDFR